jgi:hypothetical protein
LYPGEIASSTNYIGNWVSLRTGLEAVKKRKILFLQRFEPSP